MNDVNNALHIAWVATQCGCDYWLDVHDPRLIAANRAPLLSPAQEIVIAAIIEIAAQRHPCHCAADKPQRRIQMGSLRN
jgi:hypothetical protein